MTQINAPAVPAAGLRIVELTEVATHHGVAALFRQIWRLDGDQQLMEPNLIRAFAHADNYVAGAYLGGELIGASVGFFAGDGHLHSHITGVAPEHQDRGVGHALKWHQRDWALARGVGTVRWTFDPLFRRNAYFNIHKLGALPTAYLPDFYGPMQDGINAGSPTDRLYVTWDLAAAGVSAPVPARDAAMLVGRDGDRPAVRALDRANRPRSVLVALPRDIDALRETRPELADQWREAVRGGLCAALNAGYRITAMTVGGSYVLDLTS